MGRAKRVVDEHFCQLRHRLCQRRIVLFLSCVKANVLQHEHVAILERHRFRLRRLADAVVRKLDGTPEHFREPRCDGAERLLRVALAFGAAKVRGQNEPRACCNEGVEGGQRFFDAGVIGDDHCAVLLVERNIEVHTDEAAFAGKIDVADRFFSHGNWGAKIAGALENSSSLTRAPQFARSAHG